MNESIMPKAFFICEPVCVINTEVSKSAITSHRQNCPVGTDRAIQNILNLFIMDDPRKQVVQYPGYADTHMPDRGGEFRYR